MASHNVRQTQNTKGVSIGYTVRINDAKRLAKTRNDRPTIADTKCFMGTGQVRDAGPGSCSLVE